LENFIFEEEWDTIVEERDSDSQPKDMGKPLGLSNIHVFGLARIHHRPIILLNSLQSIKSFGDYAGNFLSL